MEETWPRALITDCKTLQFSILPYIAVVYSSILSIRALRRSSAPLWEIAEKLIQERDIHRL